MITRRIFAALSIAAAAAIATTTPAFAETTFERI